MDLSQLYMLEMMRKRRIAAAGGGSTPLTLTALTAGSKVTLTKVGSPPDVSLEYSTGGAWATYTIGTEITLASAGDYIKFRGDNSTFSTSVNDCYQFSMSGTIGASGNVMSLVDSTCKLLTIPGNFCFSSLFRDCTSLTTAPALPATTLAPYCYISMFRGCTGLTTAPALPATTLAEWCYHAMFQDCTALTTAPALPATTLATGCYSYMFNGCTKLSSIEVSFTSWAQATNQTSSWVYNVASSGTFTKPAALATEYGYSRIPPGWTVVDKSDAGDTTKPLTFTALAPNSTVKLNKVGSPPGVSLEYSTGGAWATYTIGTEITLASVGNSVSFRGDNSTFSTSTSNYYQFAMTGTIEASGNIMSLVDSTCNLLTIPGDFCFQFLFQGCTSLTTAPALPATTLADFCYRGMFYGCTSLTTAPALPATILAEYCYQWMFQDCTSLTTAPALPATTLAEYCYREMFSGCTGLTTAPALPATTLAAWCYESMFYGCASLTTAPALPATTLAGVCYASMFQGCTKLSSIEVSFTSWTQASSQTVDWVHSVAPSGTFTKPAALATEYGNSRIPPGWTVVDKSDAGDTTKPLTFTALAPNSTVKLNKFGSPPDVSLQYSTGGAWATYTIGTEITLASVGSSVSFRGDNSTFSTAAGYYQFVMTGTIEASGNTMSLVDSTCKSLTIPCDFCFRSLFYNCTSLTTAPALPATTLATDCYKGMFQHCTSLTTAPALPATTLASYCYLQMFQHCTSLTTAPALPATTLATGCYSHMFDGCTKLSSIEVSFASWTQATSQTLNWVDDVAPSGTFTKPAALATEYGAHRIPTGWTVVDK